MFWASLSEASRKAILPLVKEVLESISEVHNRAIYRADPWEGSEKPVPPEIAGKKCFGSFVAQTYPTIYRFTTNSETRQSSQTHGLSFSPRIVLPPRFLLGGEPGTR